MVRTLVQQWIHSGDSPSLGYELRRKVVATNGAALIVLLLLVVLGFGYLVSGNPALRAAGLNQLPLTAITLAVPRMNATGHRGAARWMLSAGCTLTVMGGIWLSSGTELDLHYFFLVIAMATGLIFPFDRRRTVGALAAINGTLFALSEVVGWPADATLEQLAPPWHLAWRLAYLLGALGAILAVTWFNDRTTLLNERLLEDLSGVDPLTGLPNRRRVMQRLEEELAMSRRIRQYLGVLYLDLDNFKPLNDGAGHEAGDELLREVARRLGACVREMDLVARVGGDEFVAVVSHLGDTPEEATRRLALVGETIRRELGQPYRITAGFGGAHQEHRCSASVGCVSSSGFGTDPHVLLQRADAAMFRAKSAGRDRVVVEDLAS